MCVSDAFYVYLMRGVEIFPSFITNYNILNYMTKLKQYDVYRLLNPSRLQLILIYLMVDKSLINTTFFIKDKNINKLQVVFSSKYKINKHLNQIYIQNFRYEHPSAMFKYNDLGFIDFLDCIIFYTSSAYKQSEGEKLLIKQIAELKQN